MNKHTAYRLLLASSLLLPTMGHAEPNLSAINVYGGAGLVSSRFNANETQLSATFDPGNTASYDNSNSSLALFIGYQFDTHLAMQISYSDIGDIVLSNGSLKQSLFGTEILNMSAVITYPVNNDLGLFGKIGAFAWDQDIADTSIDSNSGEGISYGAGLDYNLYGSKERYLRLEWDHYDFDDVFIDTVDTATLSLVFQF